MSYQSQPSTVLVARQAYSGSLGVDTSAPCAAGYVKNAYGYCISAADAAAAAAKAAEPSLIAKVGGTAVDLIKSLFGKAPTTTVVQAPSSTPEWLMPVAIGGAALVAVMLITRKRSNPARRRRHRR